MIRVKREKQPNSILKSNSGFTLIEILSVIIIIGIVAIIAIPSISNYLGVSKETVYSSYEHSMEEAAKIRIIDCITNNEDCELPEGSEMQKIYLDLLMEEGYLENMKDPDSNQFCDNLRSYVAVRGDEAKDYKYKACLYCGEYYIEGVQNQKYTVYRFTEWSEEKKPE